MGARGHSVPEWRDLPIEHKGNGPAAVGPFVYLIYAPEVDRVKIGHTQSPLKRKAEIEVGSPCKLHLAVVIPRSTREVEQDLHSTYSSWRLHGEWFDRGRDIIGHLTGRRVCPGAIVVADGPDRVYQLPESSCLVTA